MTSKFGILLELDDDSSIVSFELPSSENAAGIGVEFMKCVQNCSQSNFEVYLLLNCGDHKVSKRITYTLNVQGNKEITEKLYLYFCH